MLQVGWPDFVIRFPSGAKVFIYPIASRSALRPTRPPFQWVPVAKQTRYKADHSRTYRIEVQNGWSYTSTPSYVFMSCTGTNIPVFELWKEIMETIMTPKILPIKRYYRVECLLPNREKVSWIFKTIPFTCGAVPYPYGSWLYGYDVVPVQGFWISVSLCITSRIPSVSFRRYVFWIATVTAAEWAMLLLRWEAVERP